MKIGTCVVLEDFEGYGMDCVENRFATLRKYGFDSCQLISASPSLWTDENAALINEYVKKYDVTITVFWCGWEGPKEWNFYGGPLTLGLVPPVYRYARIKNLCDGADFARKLGVMDVATHMGFIPEDPNDANWGGFCAGVRAVARHLKKNGQWLLFETGQETPVAMLRCFEAVGTDNLAVNLDTANLILYGKANPVDALDVIGKYVRNIHAKDGFYPTCGSRLGEEVPIGTGKVDFPALFRRLHELGYDGPVTIEREIEGEQQIKDILESREYLQKIIDEVYGGNA